MSSSAVTQSVVDPQHAHGVYTRFWGCESFHDAPHEGPLLPRHHGFKRAYVLVLGQKNPSPLLDLFTSGIPNHTFFQQLAHKFDIAPSDLFVKIPGRGQSMPIARLDQFLMAMSEARRQLSENPKTRCLYIPFIVLLTSRSLAQRFDFSTWHNAYNKMLNKRVNYMQDLGLSVEAKLTLDDPPADGSMERSRVQVPPSWPDIHDDVFMRAELAKFLGSAEPREIVRNVIYFEGEDSSMMPKAHQLLDAFKHIWVFVNYSGHNGLMNASVMGAGKTLEAYILIALIRRMWMSYRDFQNNPSPHTSSDKCRRTRKLGVRCYCDPNSLTHKFIKRARCGPALIVAPATTHRGWVSEHRKYLGVKDPRLSRPLVYEDSRFVHYHHDEKVIRRLTPSDEESEAPLWYLNFAQGYSPTAPRVPRHLDPWDPSHTKFLEFDYDSIPMMEKEVVIISRESMAQFKQKAVFQHAWKDERTSQDYHLVNSLAPGCIVYDEWHEGKHPTAEVMQNISMLSKHHPFDDSVPLVSLSSGTPFSTGPSGVAVALRLVAPGDPVPQGTMQEATRAYAEALRESTQYEALDTIDPSGVLVRHMSEAQYSAITHGKKLLEKTAIFRQLDAEDTPRKIILPRENMEHSVELKDSQDTQRDIANIAADLFRTRQKTALTDALKARNVTVRKRDTLDDLKTKAINAGIDMAAIDQTARISALEGASYDSVLACEVMPALHSIISRVKSNRTLRDNPSLESSAAFADAWKHLKRVCSDEKGELADAFLNDEKFPTCLTLQRLLQLTTDPTDATKARSLVVFGSRPIVAACCYWYLCRKWGERARITLVKPGDVKKRAAMIVNMCRLAAEEGRPHILVANQELVSTGINGLQQYWDSMVMVGSGAVPENLEQAIGRLVRKMSAFKEVTVYFLSGPKGGKDDLLALRVANKVRIMNLIREWVSARHGFKAVIYPSDPAE